MAEIPSRLARYERKKAVKTAVLYLLLTAAVLFILTRFGPSFVASIAGIYPKEGELQLVESELMTTPRIDTLPQVVKDERLIVRGNATTGETVRISFNGESRDVVINAQGNWDSEFTLQEGENTIRARSVDGSGNTSSEVSTSVVFDKTPPKLEIQGPEDGLSRSGKKDIVVLISGSTDADASVKINDRVAIVSGDGTFSLNYTLSEGDNALTIIATDKAGNTTEDVRTVKYSL